METTPDGWEQQTLMPQDVVRFTLTVGIVNSGDHVQWQVAVHDEQPGRLIAMVSMPHAPLSTLQDELFAAYSSLADSVFGYGWAV